MNEKPPLFKSWNSWYLLVIAFLLLQIAVYFLLTKFFS